MAPETHMKRTVACQTVAQGSVMSPIVHLVESRAFETLLGIPHLTGRQRGVFEGVSSHQPSTCSGQVYGRVQSLQSHEPCLLDRQVQATHTNK